MKKNSSEIFLCKKFFIEVNEILIQYFNGDGTNSVEDGEVATDEEVGDVLENYFN